MSATGAPTIERFDVTVGPFTLEGIDHWIPERAPERFNEELLAHPAAHPA